MSADDTPAPEGEVTLAELTALRAGELTAAQEATLRMRMAKDPEADNKLWALDNVHRLFELDLLRGSELPAEMPYDVAARLQARIAEHALRRHEHTLPDERLPAPEDGEEGLVRSEDQPSANQRRRFDD